MGAATVRAARKRENSPPEGTIVFLFTDIEGSTERWEADRDAASADIRQHDELLSQAIREAGGYIFKTVGDAFCAAFSRADAALGAAVAAQRALIAAVWKGSSLRVRMGLHAGTAELRNGDYFGLELSRAARISAAAAGGQVLLSESAWALARATVPTDVEFIDLGSHRFKGISGSERLHQACWPGGIRNFPPLHDLDARSNNLPAESTSFIGRARELEELAALLRSSRLVTLAGMGGSGKTRLALHSARETLDRYEGGVWFVDLSRRASPEGLPSAILEALGLPAFGNDPLDQARAWLSGREALLILDNCEHLIDAVAEIAESLLGSCPRLRLLATSREPLAISGETVFRVPPLSLPGLEEGKRTSELGQYDAVRLFIDRARASAPGFRVDEDSAPWIAEICFRVEGLALAIELSAARCASMSLREIAAGLAERLDFLRSPARSTVVRQKTLRSLIDWSWELLEEGERGCLSRIALFSGEFDRDAVREICGKGSEDFLERLVAKSLVTASIGISTTRYRLADSIREYARERLAASGDGNEAWKSFSERLDRLTSNSYRRVFQRGGLDLAAEIFSAREDCYAAIERRLGRGDPMGLELLGQAGWALLLKGEFIRVGGLCTRALAILEPDPLPETRIPFVATAARACFTADGEAARRLVRRGVATAKAVGDAGLEARMLTLLGSLERGAGFPFGFGGLDPRHCDFSAALDRYREAEGAARRSGETHALIEALGGRGVVLTLTRSEPGALAQLDEAKALAMKEGDGFSLAWIELDRRAALSHRGRHEEALEAVRSGLVVAERARDPQLFYLFHEGFRATLMAARRFHEAIDFAHRAYEFAKDMGLRWMVIQAELNLLEALGANLCQAVIESRLPAPELEQEFRCLLKEAPPRWAELEGGDLSSRLDDAFIIGALTLAQLPDLWAEAVEAANLFAGERANDPWTDDGERTLVQWLNEELGGRTADHEQRLLSSAADRMPTTMTVERLVALVPELAPFSAHPDSAP